VVGLLLVTSLLVLSSEVQCTLDASLYSVDAA